MLFTRTSLVSNIIFTNFFCGGMVLKKLIIQIIVASCLAILLPIIGVFIASSNFENESFYMFTRAATSIGGLLFAIYTLIPTVKLVKMLSIRDSILSVLAGFILILLWYIQYALGFIHFFDTSFLWYIYPLISSIILILIIKHKQMIYALAKISIFLIAAIFFNYFLGFFNLHYVILNYSIPGYGRMSAGGGFGLMVSSFYYFVINAVVILIYLFFCKRTKTDSDHVTAHTQ